MSHPGLPRSIRRVRLSGCLAAMHGALKFEIQKPDATHLKPSGICHRRTRQVTSYCTRKKNEEI